MMDEKNESMNGKNESVVGEEHSEIRKELSEYFEDVTGAPLCDAIAHSIQEFASKDTVYQELEREEERWEKKCFERIGAMEQEDADVVNGYVDAIRMTCCKKKELAYMAGVRDAVMMLRYMDVIKDRW